MPSRGRQRLKSTNSGVSVKPKRRMGEKFQDLCASSKEPLQPLNRVDFSLNKDSRGSTTSGSYFRLKDGIIGLFLICLHR